MKAAAVLRMALILHPGAGTRPPRPSKSVEACSPPARRLFLRTTASGRLPGPVQVVEGPLHRRGVEQAELRALGDLRSLQDLQGLGLGEAELLQRGPLPGEEVEHVVLEPGGDHRREGPRRP